MNRASLLILIVIFASLFHSFAQSRSVLVFSKTMEYVHESIESGNKAIHKLGKENNFKVETTKDATQFTGATLQKYDAVIFLNTTGNVLTNDQQAAFQQYINAGGGFVGIHSATDTEYDWPWYGKLVGAYFESHPDQQKARLTVQNENHPTTKLLPKDWYHYDEWYNFKHLSPHIKVVLTVDETSYTGGKHGSFHPISWYQEYDGGKMFYTALGHTKESYANDLFLQHLLGGILYVLK